MTKGFRISTLISFNISVSFRRHQSLHQTSHHVNSPFLLKLFSSSSYNNSSDDGRRPPPRRRPTDGFTTSNRPQSSSRLSGFIDDNDERVAGEYRARGNREERGRERRDFDNNRKPNYDNDSKYRRSNRPDNRKSEGNSSYVPFDDDDEKNPQFAPVNPSPRVSDSKVQDVDGFLDRFKLGFDEEKNKPSFENLSSGKIKPNFENLSSGRAAGEAEESTPAPPPEDADEIFRKMKETGLIPNAVAMLHGLCSDGLVQDALKLFGVMRERGSIPEVVIYTAVVEGFCKAHKPDEGVRIFRKMQSNGIVPNAFSYGVLVQGLVKGERLDDAFEWCLEMVEAGHSPNLGTFTGLVSAFCRERGLESAQVVIGKLKDKGFGYDDKGVREFMEKKGPFSPMVWEAIFGKKGSQMF